MLHSRNKIGAYIRRERRRLGKSMQSLGDCVSVSRQYISQIELGQVAIPAGSDLLIALADALCLDVDDLHVREGRLPDDMVRNLRDVVRVYREHQVKERISA